MPTFNKAILVGNLAAEPDVRPTQTNKTYGSFPLATNRSWVDKDGNKQTDVDFHRITCWNNLAKQAAKHLKKGMLVLIEGRINNRTYKLPDGKTAYITEVIAENFQILDWKDQLQQQHKKGKQRKVAAAGTVG